MITMRRLLHGAPRALALVLAALFGACTSDGVTGVRDARVIAEFITPATVRALIVEVSGPGIDQTIVHNVTVGTDSIARDTLQLPAGSARRFVITAIDTAGVVTHRADTTVTLEGGALRALTIRLRPLDASLGITVTFGGSRLTVADTSWRRLTPGDTLRILATGITPGGAAVTASGLTWGSLDPSVFTVRDGLITAVREGVATLVVSYGGASVRLLVDVWSGVGGPLTDPDSLRILMGESVSTWFNTHEGMYGAGPLVTQAQTYSASWNNFNMNFYSSIDNPGDPLASWNRNTRGWTNTPSTPAYTSVRWYWDGYQSVLAQAGRLRRSLRLGASLGTASATQAASAITYLMQGAAIAGLALNYDKAILVNESGPGSTGFLSRRALRDTALVRLDSAIAVAGRSSFVTPAEWANGPTYTNDQIARVARTMAANLLANWPRNSTENAAVDWSRVVAYASQGISAGTRFDYTFIGDGGNRWSPEILIWFNSMDTGRLSTRVAAMLDPATQQHPYPVNGNPQPNSPDRRLGDGSFGDASMVAGFGNVPRTANAGTDFAWSSQAVFNMSRGSYHQSNIAHIRYDASGTQSPSGIYGGYGPAPTFSAAQNDLLWAEGLIEQGSNLALAATLINNTRVTRGGLSAATAAEGAAGLRTKLRYEQEIELLGLGAASFYHRRRVDGLITATPREMPVPAEVLATYGLPSYSWGGSNPVSSPTPP